MRAGINDGYRGAFALADSVRAHEAECLGRVLLGGWRDVTDAPSSVSGTSLGRLGEEVGLGVKQARVACHPLHRLRHSRAGRQFEQIDVRSAREGLERGRSVGGVDLLDRNSWYRIQLDDYLVGYKAPRSAISLRATGGTRQY